eukprot:CAMPEP_0172451770 /NCGR_PEP_ID=MMETSP1065-20121228/9664_1 /TAXON_ID=265537 /ORGANISM="Amphiprora paludosa, Strain CCMP125" /LENGTH=772 /DNA_ID=CAMNT_0013203741 /DNA_START=118 /DNA_END=2436 /DNA_ORIENTATION=+
MVTRIVLTVAILWAEVQQSAAFLLPERKAAFTGAASRLQAATSTGENGILLMQQGLNLMLLPNEEMVQQSSIFGGSSSSITIGEFTVNEDLLSKVLDPSKVSSPPPKPIVEAVAPVVKAAAPVKEVVAPVVKVVEPVKEVVAPVVQAAAPVKEVVAPVVEAVAPVQQVVEPIIQPQPVLEILPKPVSAPVVSTGDLGSASYKDAVEAFRQFHNEKLPTIVPTSPGGSGKAPSFLEFMGDQTSSIAASLKNSYENFDASQLSTSSLDMQKLSSKDIPKITIMVDPEKYQALKNYLQEVKSATKFITVEELKDMLHLDQIQVPTVQELEHTLGIDNLKAISETSLNFASEGVDKTLVSWGTFVDSVNAVKATLETTPDDLSKVYDAMNIRETGAWYIGATVGVMLLFGSTVNYKVRKIVLTDAAMPETKAEKDGKGTEKKLTPQQEAKAQELTDKAAAKKLMDEQVQTLKDATMEVYEQLAALKEEKNTRAYDVATMKSELRTVMNKLDLTVSEEQNLRVSLEATQKKLKEETTFLRKELEQRAAAEEDLRDQLAKTKDKLADETKKVKKAKEDAKGEVVAAEAEVKKLAEEKAEMEQSMMMLRKEVSELQQQLTGEEPANVLKEPTKSSEPKRKSKTQKGTTLPTTTSYSEMSDSFFEAISEPVEAKKSAVRGAKEETASTATKPKSKKKASKKVSIKKAQKKSASAATVSTEETPETTVGASDLSSLSPSALKRKTVKELTEYLEAKGAPTTDAEGKKLKKDFLVQTILSSA